MNAKNLEKKLKAIPDEIKSKISENLLDTLFLENLYSNIQDSIDYRLSLERDFSLTDKAEVVTEAINLNSDYAYNLLKQIEKLQGPAFLEPACEWVPAHKLAASLDNGGIVCVSYIKKDQDRILLGFIEASPAVSGNIGSFSPYIYVHVIATHPNIKKKISGIGEEMLKNLKIKAFSLGYELAKWTYDPLQSENANLYIKKCCGIVSDYVNEKYILAGHGAGIPGDRFIVNWHFNSENVVRRLDKAYKPFSYEDVVNGIKIANTTIVNVNFFRENKKINNNLKNEVIAIEIPANFTQMCRESKPIASKWRNESRLLFPAYFSSGYIITDFVTNYKKGLPAEKIKCFYILKKGG